jgi:hypothetical protein
MSGAAIMKKIRMMVARTRTLVGAARSAGSQSIVVSPRATPSKNSATKRIRTTMAMAAIAATTRSGSEPASRARIE